MNHVQYSNSEKHDRTTQYISHGVNCARSEVRRALYEAKIGKDTVIIDLGAEHGKYMANLEAVVVER